MAMKLFVWNEPYACLYVVAETEERAREIAKTTLTSKFGFTPEGPTFGDMPIGKPDRVIETPCAEIYFWQE